MVKSRVVLKDCDRDRNGEIESKSCNNIAGVNNVFDDQQTGITTASQSTESGRVQVKQVKRKRQPNLKPANKKDGNEMKYVKDRRSRPKVISDDVPQRRSPRNTVEAREARAQSRSLRNKELHNGGEDVCGKLSEEKQALAALFLSEINRKLSSVVWRQ